MIEIDLTPRCLLPSCGKISTKTCAKCHTASYCSRECQRDHWNHHKHLCKALAENRARLPQSTMSNPEINLPPCCSRPSCGKDSAKQCAKCHIAAYCSRECQLDHWNHRKKLCKKIRCPENRARYEEAMKRYQIGVDLMTGGRPEEALARDYESLRLRRQDEALEEFSKSLQIYLELLGEDDIFTASCYHEIGIVQRERGQFDDALVNLRKALEFYKVLLGEENNSIAALYDGIGKVLFEQERFDDALIGMGKALSIRLKLYGENHINTASSYYNIGSIQVMKAQYEEAIKSFRKALSIRTRELGETHPATGAARAQITGASLLLQVLSG